MSKAVTVLAGIVSFVVAMISARQGQFDAATYFMVSAFMFFWMSETRQK